MKHFQRSGGMLDFSKADIGKPEVKDLLYSIAYEKRYSGQILWTVLQHSLVMGRTARALNWDKKLVRYCYLHDLHEGVIRDVPTPFKRAVGEAWYRMEHSVQHRLYKALGAPELKGLEDNEKFKALDGASAYYEAMYFYGSNSLIMKEYWGNSNDFSYLFATWKKMFNAVKDMPIFDTDGEVLETVINEFKQVLPVPVA